MIFDLTISITDIISVLAILLTFVTILQIKHQRTDTLKPYMTVRPIDEVYHFDCKNKRLKEKPIINLCNIGSNLAKNINIELYSYNIPNALLSKTLQITQNSCSIDKQKLIILHHNIDFTYCEPKENIEIGSTLYGYIETFCHIYEDLFLSNKEECIRQTPKVIIKVSYLNILGKKNYIYLCLHEEISVLSINEIDFYIKTYEISKKQYEKIITDLNKTR